ALADTWVILADWNVPFEDIAKTGFVQQIGGALIKPNVEVTCDKGKGSLIDYGITRTDFVDKVKLQAVRKVPWRTHCGLTLTLDGASRPWWHRIIVLPKELATPAKPKKKADPNSQRSRKRQEERQRAEERLEPHLREAFQSKTVIEEEAERHKEKPYYITDEIWAQTMASESHEWELSDELKSWDGGLIIRGQRHGTVEAAVTKMYAEWVTCLEESAIITDEIAEKEADQ
ncbi:unnamed protein product, partial [Prorocentrum cordatum]